MGKQTITIKQAAALMEVPGGAIFKYIKNGKLTSIKTDKRLLVYEDEILALKRKTRRWRWLNNLKRLLVPTLLVKLVDFGKRHLKAVVLSVAIPVLGLALQYFIARPRMIVDEVSMLGNNPYSVKFILKNSGIFDARNLNIRLFSPFFRTTRNLVVMPGPRQHPTFNDVSIISGINVPSEQRYSFSLERWFDSYFPMLKRREKAIGELKDALIQFRCSYRDYLWLPYTDGPFCYYLHSEDGKFSWEPIGPKMRQKFIDQFPQERAHEPANVSPN